MIYFFRRLILGVVLGLMFAASGQQQTLAQESAGNIDVILASLEQKTGTDLHLQMCDLLTGYPEGGDALSKLVRSLVLKSPKLASGFIDLVTCAGSGQKAGIGAGLGQAASIINEKDPDAATAIAQLVAAGNDNIIQTSFIAAVGGGTAATGGGTTAGTAGGRSSGPRAGSLAVQSSGGGSGGGDPVSPSS